jgi:hypothetical protein
MRKGIIAALMLLALAAPAAAAIADKPGGAAKPMAGTAPAIALPKDGDEYAKLVARAAGRDLSVDFRALRFAYLKSKARRNSKANVDALRTALFDAVKANDTKRVRDTAVALLSADYIDMYGHKFLRQACAVLYDAGCAEQGHFVEFGLLDSILKSGDGKTCDTGWEVVTIAEEYFILGMMEAKVLRQSLVSGKHGACDLLMTKDGDGKEHDIYFRADAILADEKAGLKHH